MNLVLNNYILYIKKKKYKNKENLTVNKLDFFRHFWWHNIQRKV